MRQNDEVDDARRDVEDDVVLGAAQHAHRVPHAVARAWHAAGKEYERVSALLAENNVTQKL